jgi:hypothetical protein
MVRRLTPKFSRMRRRRNSPPRQSLAPHVGCNATLAALLALRANPIREKLAQFPRARELLPTSRKMA